MGHSVKPEVGATKEAFILINRGSSRSKKNLASSSWLVNIQQLSLFKNEVVSSTHFYCVIVLTLTNFQPNNVISIRKANNWLKEAIENQLQLSGRQYVSFSHHNTMWRGTIPQNKQTDGNFIEKVLKRRPLLKICIQL